MRFVSLLTNKHVILVLLIIGLILSKWLSDRAWKEFIDGHICGDNNESE